MNKFDLFTMKGVGTLSSDLNALTKALAEFKAKVGEAKENRLTAIQHFTDEVATLTQLESQLK